MEHLGEKIRKHMVKAIHDYSMLEDGDRVMVCTSGGKDSTIMLLLFQALFSWSDPLIGVIEEGVALIQGGIAA